MGMRRAVVHSLRIDENDVSVMSLEARKLWEPDLTGQSTDSTSSGALGCHLWPTFPERPAFTRKIVHALVFHRSIKPTVHRGEDR